MVAIMKKYLDITGGEENKLLVETGYSLGGYNWYNGTNNARGYYLYVTPVTLHDRGGYQTVEETLGKGLKMLLKGVSRKSQKASEEAEQKAVEIMDFLVSKVCEQYGYELV